MLGKAYTVFLGTVCRIRQEFLCPTYRWKQRKGGRKDLQLSLRRGSNPMSFFCYTTILILPALDLCHYIIMQILLVSPAVHNSRIHGGCTSPLKLLLHGSELVPFFLHCQCFRALCRGCSSYTIMKIHIPCSFVSIKAIFSFYTLNVPLHDSFCSLDTYMTLFIVIYECLIT